MIFKDIRQAALVYWLNGTNRERIDGDDDISGAYECNWQNNYQTPPELETEHISIFCSMGEWNTMITDFLEDLRFDGLDLSDDAAHNKLFRHYSEFFLIVSEIMTDFQDVLTMLRTGNIDPLTSENGTSRTMLTKYAGTSIEVQDLFTYINQIVKHKARNIHLCNHHIPFCFEDAGTSCTAPDTVEIGNVDQFISKKPSLSPARTAATISVPKLQDVITVILNGYRVVDEEFLADHVRFAHFRQNFRREILSQVILR